MEIQYREPVLHLPIDGFSHLNRYIPLYAAWSHRGMHRKRLDDGVFRTLHYSIPMRTVPIKLKSGYRYLYQSLMTGTMARIFQTHTMDKPLYAMKGLLFEIVDSFPVIHLMIAVEKCYFFKMDLEKPDLERFKLIVSSDFSNSLVFKHIATKFKKEVLYPMNMYGVDTIVTNNVNKWSFKNSLTLPDFKTWEKREEYLKTFKKHLFHE